MSTTTQTAKVETGASGVTFKLEDLNKALRYGFDVLDRTQAPFVLLDETAKTIREKNRLDVQEITFGVLEKHLNRYVLSVLRTYKFEKTDNGYEGKHKDIPIRVKIISKSKYLDRTDSLIYMGDDFRIPNPFDSYWKSRGLVK